jgi:hypothetical protein
MLLLHAEGDICALQHFWAGARAATKTEIRLAEACGWCFQDGYHILRLKEPAHSDSQQSRLRSAITLTNLGIRPSALASNWKSTVLICLDIRLGAAALELLPAECPPELRPGRLYHVFLPLEPLHALVFQAPTRSPEQVLCHLLTPADMVIRDLTMTMPQLSLLDREDLGQMTLSAGVLTHLSADQSTRSPEKLSQDSEGLPAALGAQKFPLAWSTTIACSSAVSTRRLMSRAYSFFSLLLSLLLLPEANHASARQQHQQGEGTPAPHSVAAAWWPGGHPKDPCSVVLQSSPSACAWREASEPMLVICPDAGGQPAGWFRGGVTPQSVSWWSPDVRSVLRRAHWGRSAEPS